MSQRPGKQKPVQQRQRNCRFTTPVTSNNKRTRCAHTVLLKNLSRKDKAEWPKMMKSSNPQKSMSTRVPTTSEERRTSGKYFRRRKKIRDSSYQCNEFRHEHPQSNVLALLSVPAAFEAQMTCREKTSPKKIPNSSFQDNEFQHEFHHGSKIIARY